VRLQLTVMSEGHSFSYLIIRGLAGEPAIKLLRRT